GIRDFHVTGVQTCALPIASGTVKTAATGCIRIVAPFLPFSVMARVCAGLLRAHGAARHAMNVTLSMGITNAILDPIFIFGFGLGISGAAIATSCAAVVSSILAVVPIIRYYGGLERFSTISLREDFKPIFAILLPAILTNLATPLGGFITYRYIAQYPDEVIAGFAVMGRVIPFAF